MLTHYQAKYRDKYGEEETVIENDGHNLRMVVRGVQFSSGDSTTWETTVESEEEFYLRRIQATYSDNRFELCYFSLSWVMPIRMIQQDRDIIADLHVCLDYNESIGHPAMGAFMYTFRLVVNEQAFEWQSQMFSSLSGEPRELLPDGLYLKACINCAYSDYSPFGYDTFGTLECYRGNKSGYLSVKTKHDLLDIEDTVTEFVQETYLCPEFCLRQVGTGFRG